MAVRVRDCRPVRPRSTAAGLSFWLASYLHERVALDRQVAVLMVTGLYAANLVGRFFASRLSRRQATPRVLRTALLTGLVGLPILLTASGAATAAVGQILGPLLAGAVAHSTGLRLGLLILPALVILGLSALAWPTTRSPTANEPNHTP